MPQFMSFVEKSVILLNIRSAHNVGSIFRTADGGGASKVYLVGYTPTPIDRFGRTQPEIQKTSLGASEMVPWKYFETIESCMTALRAGGVTIVAVEQSNRAVDYRTYPCPDKVAFVFGNEREGIPHNVCDQSDSVIMIPMKGKKESLNVSVTAGIILFHFT